VNIATGAANSDSPKPSSACGGLQRVGKSLVTLAALPAGGGAAAHGGKGEGGPLGTSDKMRRSKAKGAAQGF